MKPWKILPCILLLSGAAFLLSGCALLSALFADDTIQVKVFVSGSHAGATNSSSNVSVSVSGPLSETNSGGYSGATSGGKAIYNIPDFSNLEDGSYTVTATFTWNATSGVGLPIQPSTSSSQTVNLSSPNAQLQAVTFSF